MHIHKHQHNFNNFNFLIDFIPYAYDNSTKVLNLKVI